VIIRPMLNTLMVLYVVLFNQMGVAIIAFTILVRLITLPLTLKQINQMRAMSALAPKLREVQTRYGRDRARASQETMRLYREAGVSPVGCLGPMVIQMPILFGLYQVLVQTLFTRPDDLVALSEKLYSWIPLSSVYTAAPLNEKFLWLDLSEPDPSRIITPLLVAASTWVQQKMTTTPSTDPRQQSSQNMMLWMIPIMLGFFALSFPSGLSLYWIVSNIIGIAIQYFVAGWGPLFPLFPKAEQAPAPAPTPQTEPPKEIGDNGSARHHRSNRRRSHRTGAERARRRPRRGRGRNPK
jgi:YidC/Oxa1 family membrane protein insertase